jgi:hypothetical protein
MRTFVLFVLLIGAVALVMTGTHQARMEISDGPAAISFPGVHIPAVDIPAIEIPTPPKMPTAVRTTTKKAKRAPAAVTAPRTLQVVGEARKTREEAWTAALEAAARTIEQEYGLSQELPAREAELQNLIRDHSDSQVSLGKAGGESLGTATIVTMNLELTPEYVAGLGQRERAFRMEDRMGNLARALAVVVAGLFAVSGYVRLEEWSKGYYAGLWKTLAVLAVIGVGVAAFVVR